MLAQSGLDEKRAAVSPAVAEQLPTALATGGTVRILTADYATHIAGTAADSELLQHLRTDPEGLSYSEATEFQRQQPRRN